jgi:dihydroorotate dehydrogenase electron transfer subunit
VTRKTRSGSNRAVQDSPGTGWCQIQARVARQVERGAGHRWLELDLPSPFRRPLPGQFVQLLLAADASGPLLPRPMSVADVTRRGSGWRVGFLYAPVGVGTRALARLESGQTVDVLGPLGRGYPLAEPGTPVLVAGGRGVAPLLLAARLLNETPAAASTRSARAHRGPGCEFLFGVRSASHLIGLADARQRLKRVGGRLHVCTDDGSQGHHGNAVGLLDRLAPRLEWPIVIHACGPHGMLRAVAEWAIARDVRAFLAMESVMACGTGVCRGCPLPRSAPARAAFAPDTPSLYGNADYAMCCTEGPVFEARDLDWERVA